MGGGDWKAEFKGNEFQIFCLEWETVKTSEPVKETVQTTQSPTPVEKETVVTTQAEVFPPPVAMLQVSTSWLLSNCVSSVSDFLMCDSLLSKLR